jgi:hypothetical protein
MEVHHPAKSDNSFKYIVVFPRIKEAAKYVYFPEGAMEEGIQTGSKHMFPKVA